MAVEVILPKIGFSMNEGTIAEWLAADGAEVKEGEPLFLLEADKSTNEVESPATGTLKIIAQTGEAQGPVGALRWPAEDEGRGQRLQFRQLADPVRRREGGGDGEPRQAGRREQEKDETASGHGWG